MKKTVLEQEHKKKNNKIKNKTGYASIDKPWNKFYSKDALNITIPNETIYDTLKKTCNECPNAVAIYYFGTKITYKMLLRKIDIIANCFLKKGVKKGEIVTIAIPNIPENIICLYALNKIGAISNMIDLTSKGDNLVRYINETNTSLLIASDVFIDNVNDILHRTSVKNVIVTSPSNYLPPVIKQIYNLKNKKELPASERYETWNEFAKIGKKSLNNIKEDYSKDEGIVILHTSGTTGDPKGVVLTNENLNVMVLQYKYSGLEFKPNDKFLNQVPPFLAYNIVMAVHLPLILKMQIVMLPNYQPHKFAENLMKYRVNHVVAGPGDWNNIREKKEILKDMSFLKTLASGSDLMDVSHKDEVNTQVELHGCKNKVIEGYGQTEGGCADSTNLPQCNVKGSIGIPLPQMTFCIYDSEKNKELKYNEEGEICICGPTVMKEYYNNKEATKETLKVHEDGKLWLHTGDLGKINEDGVLFLSGRIKRIIIRYDGIKVSPFNIEKIIRKNSSVESCCVVGVKDKENGRGEVPIANIVLKPEFIQDSKRILLEIKKSCENELGEKYLPNKYLIRDNLPLTKVGKVDYKLLEKQNMECIYNNTKSKNIKNADEKEIDRQIDENTNKEKSKQNDSSDKHFNRKLKKLELALTFLSIILGSSIIINIAMYNNIHIGDTIINNSSSISSVEKEMLEAQEYYLNGKYLKAYEIFFEYREEVASASLNLGYLYSKGLGCEKDFTQACNYYKKAYEMGLKEGIDNYIALNLITPNSLKETVEALEYGYEKNNEIALRYLSYLQTGIMYESYNEKCLNNAKVFLQKDIYKQMSILKESLVLASVDMQKINNNNVPNNTEFKTYTKYTDLLENTNTTSIVLPFEENEEKVLILKDIKVYEEVEYYIINTYKFAFSDYLLEEKYYKL